MPRVSVIIPSYNHEKYVAQAIQSVLNQIYQDFEIIITDDGSQDNSLQVIETFKDPRIRLFCFEKNRGAAVAANHCLEQATGEFIAMLSSDDLFMPDKLTKQVTFLDENPHISAVFSYAHIINQDGRAFLDENHFYKQVFIQQNRNRFEWLNYFFFHGNCLCHPSALIRKNCYEKIGKYDERFAQLPDFDFWVRLCLNNEIYILPENLIEFRIFSNEVNASGNTLKTRIRSTIEYILILKHYLNEAVLKNFDQIFPSSLVNSEQPETEDGVIRFNLAMIALKEAKLIPHKFFALDILYKLLDRQNRNIINRIQDRFSFEYIDLIKLSGEVDAFNIASLENIEPIQEKLRRSQSQLQQTQERLENLELRIKQLNQQERQNQLQIDLLNHEIAAMKTSKFWKLRTLWFEFKLRVKLLSKKLHVYPSLKELYRAFSYSSKLKTNNQVPLPEKGVVINETLNHKEILTKTYTAYLHNFLNSNTKLKLPTHSQPLISIILVLYNRAELTLQCLISLAANCTEPFEVIIVDNASSDSTKALLNRIEGAKIILNNQNLHFLLASNQAAKEALGKYILFLNNDAQVLPGSITSAIKTMTESEDIGAVGGKIILLDGTLQEAGSIVWQDGSCLGYGRGDKPNQPMYMFRRDVDYCSGAFLLTKRHLFVENGGFDQDYKPAYYEETDYCMRLWRMNQRVVYDPNVIILHYEFASSKTVDSALSLQTQHREIFLSKHQEKLQHHYSPDPSNILMARETNHYCSRILVIDDRVPHSFLGCGLPRARDILYSLLELNYFVTLYPLYPYEDNYYVDDWQNVYQDIPNNVEIMLGYNLENFADFLFDRQKYYDVILISRPHNFQALQSIIVKVRESSPDLKIIYDAEALFSLRDISKSKVEGYEILEADINQALARELELPQDADRIITVSAQEAQKFVEFGYKEVYTLGHLVPVAPTENSFDSRSDILFVGLINEDDSPNADSIFWFVNEIWPIIQDRLGSDLNFNIVGLTKSQKILNLRRENIKIFGAVDDLQMFFNSARMFVAPTRFAAGIPMKVHTAASYGLPIVTTSLIAAQVNWENGTDLLSADDHLSFAEQCIRLYTEPNLWQMLRTNALHKISQECSREVFGKNLQRILQF